MPNTKAHTFLPRLGGSTHCLPGPTLGLREKEGENESGCCVTESRILGCVRFLESVLMDSSTWTYESAHASICRQGINTGLPAPAVTHTWMAAAPHSKAFPGHCFISKCYTKLTGMTRCGRPRTPGQGKNHLQKLM